MIQPPRGFGENPIAIYHDPDLPPTHHYLAAYRWLAAPQDGASAPTRSCTSASTAPWSGCRARTLGLSAQLRARRRARRPAAGLPVPRQRPRRGHPGQAPRARHVVDHLVPPMARAETYGDIARLEQLLDEYATVAAMDPAKLPAVRGADLEADPGRRAAPRPAGSTSSRTTTSSTTSCCTSTAGCARSRTSRSATGCTCSARRRSGEARVNLVLAMLRAPQVLGRRAGPAGPAAGAGAALGLDEQALLASRAPGAVPTALTEAVDGPPSPPPTRST